ncbi:unnamed protein product [Closterium sp. NIES-54]
MLPLEKLPDSIGLLTGLQKLFIDCMLMDTVPAAISSLSSLELLTIRHSRLPNPEEIGELTNLLTLVLSSCADLQQLPSSLGRLSSLTRLSITNCPIVSLPEGIGQLGGLRELTLSRCKELTELPAGIHHSAEPPGESQGPHVHQARFCNPSHGKPFIPEGAGSDGLCSLNGDSTILALVSGYLEVGE